MASRSSRPPRLLLPTILAIVLAVELTGLVLARTSDATAPVQPPAPAAATPKVGVLAGRGPSITESSRQDPAKAFVGIAPVSPYLTRITRRAGPPPVSRAVAKQKPPKSGGSAGHKTGPTYHGVNHVWIPTLRINKSVQSFPCSRSRPPDAGAYRWGCSGRNNVYLLSHAWSTFKPLHDAYVAGRLRKAMKVIYADSGGHVHTYSVVWWKVVAPTTAASWAWAPLGRPSMTLQTCVGSKSQYRLMVRLVQTG